MNQDNFCKAACAALLTVLVATGSPLLRADTPSKEARALISEVEDLYSKCRGGAGNDPYTHLACYEMEDPADKLQKLDWCYGPQKEVGYKKKWIRCSSDPSPTVAPRSASAKLDINWNKFSSTTYFMRPEALDRPLLIASIFKGNIFLNLLELDSALCRGKANGQPEEAPPYEINDTYVKIQSVCSGGNRVFGPSTDAGRKLLLNSVNSTNTKIEVDGYPPLIFYKTDFESVRRELLKTESAL